MFMVNQILWLNLYLQFALYINFYFSGISFNSSYPCVVGYDYLVTSSAVWLFFLPFWILALFGTCWRQCCCCCCDPIVLCGTLTDLIKVCTEHKHYSLFICIIVLWFKWVLNFGWWNNMQKDEILSYHVCMMLFEDKIKICTHIFHKVYK